MSSTYTQLQLRATRALIKFIEDHDGNISADLRSCLDALEEANVGVAVHHAKKVKPHGMGGITDWFPAPTRGYETEEYAEQVLFALTNEWCRVIALSFEERDTVSRSAQKGELKADMRADGYVLCPFCGWMFSSKSSSSWDGLKHISCGVRLRLVAETVT